MFDLWAMCSQLCANCFPSMANNRPCQSPFAIAVRVYLSPQTVFPFLHILFQQTLAMMTVHIN